MVTRTVLSLSLALVGFLSVSSGAARDYTLGDRAEENITTPVPLIVIDTAATEALKEKEAQRVPVIYRYYPQAVDEVEAAFHSTFVRTRSNFMEALQARFKQPALTAEETASSDFPRFLTQFQRQNILYPVGPNLARIWARGQSDVEVESALIARLREMMKLYIRPDVGPKDIWVGSTIRLVSLADSESVTAQLAQERGFTIAKTNFISVQRGKSDLIDSFPAEERSVAKYLASFLKANCTMEAELTRELRAQRTAGLLAADRFNAGELIVKRGQVVDQKVLAALTQLREKTAVTQLEKLAPSPAKSTESRSLPFWIAGGVTIAVIFFGLLWRAAQRQARAARLPMSASATAIVSNAGQLTLSDENWRERALLAEQRAENAQAMVRAGLMGQLAQWMARKMTRKMIAQRAQLLDDHHRAAIEVAELEARLEKVQAPLLERLQAYERRIADLESELTMKGEENRELIKAKIQIIRKQLEIEREKNRLEFN